MEVLNALRPGLDEKLYERALTLERKPRGHVVSVQRSFPVWYRGELIGNLVPDLIVDNTIIVDPKVVVCFTETPVAQMIRYLNITGLRPRASDPFQRRATGMEASVASARKRGRHPV